MWNPIHNVHRENFTLRIVSFYCAFKHFWMPNKKKIASVLLWAMQWGRIYSERARNTDDHMQFKHKILAIKFWRRSLRGRKCSCNCTIRFREEHPCVEHGVDAAKTAQCPTPAWLLREGTRRGGLCLGGAAFVPCAGAQDRLELVPATGPAWLHSEPPRNAAWGSPHPATLAGTQNETGNPNPGDPTALLAQPSRCLPPLVNQGKHD